jgi:RNA polymerase sigma-70 factor (ECF subfamily)
MGDASPAFDYRRRDTQPMAAGHPYRVMDVVTAVIESSTRAPDTADAFADWVRPQIAVMTRLAARLAPGADHEDIVQEALVRAWRKRQQFDPAKGSPAAWLCAIIADQARRARRRRRPFALLASIPARVRSTEDRLDVEYAVGRLAPRQRLAVDCFYFVGLSVSETASVMACSEGTVKSTLSDARNRLRSLLEVSDEPR